MVAALLHRAANRRKRESLSLLLLLCLILFLSVGSAAAEAQDVAVEQHPSSSPRRAQRGWRRAKFNEAPVFHGDKTSTRVVVAKDLEEILGENQGPHRRRLKATKKASKSSAGRAVVGGKKQKKSSAVSSSGGGGGGKKSNKAVSSSGKKSSGSSSSVGGKKSKSSSSSDNIGELTTSILFEIDIAGQDLDALDLNALEDAVEAFYEDLLSDDVSGDFTVEVSQDGDALVRLVSGDTELSVTYEVTIEFEQDENINLDSDEMLQSLLLDLDAEEQAALFGVLLGVAGFQGTQSVEVSSPDDEMLMSSRPTVAPTVSVMPTISELPSVSPSIPPAPSSEPSNSPSIPVPPSNSPSNSPSIIVVTEEPSNAPSSSPSVLDDPSSVPSNSPSIQEEPSNTPSGVPSSLLETPLPSNAPSSMPSTPEPSSAPSESPSSGPSVSAPNRFNIQLQNVGTANAELDRVMRDAANRWERIIKDDLPDFPMAEGEASFFQAPPMSPDTPRTPFFTDENAAPAEGVDDLLIGYELVTTLPSTILGQAQIFQSSGGLTSPFRTITGGIRFNATAFQSRPRADNVLIAIHEIGHLIGVGPAWQLRCGTECRSDSDEVYTCRRASTEYDNLNVPGGTSVLLIEASVCGHWSDDSFPSSNPWAELMTPAFAASIPQLITRVTVGAIEDLGGYGRLDFDAADSIPSLLEPTPASSLLVPSRSFRLINNSTTGEVSMIDTD